MQGNGGNKCIILYCCCLAKLGGSRNGKNCTERIGCHGFTKGDEDCGFVVVASLSRLVTENSLYGIFDNLLCSVDYVTLN